MIANSEIRRKARATLKAGWFWRMAIVVVTLQALMHLVSGLLGAAFRAHGISSWMDFAQAKLEAAQAGLGYTLPSMRAGMEMLGASLFQSFIGYIFGAIVAFGIAGAAIKAMRDRRERWFADAFGGFARPFEVTWLLAIMNLKIALWSLLFVIPGIVAMYRYRNAWFIKNERPELKTSECLAESGRMMKGYKWKAFCFDLSYFGWLALACLALGVAAGAGVAAKDGGSMIFGLLAAIASFGAMYLLLFVLVYFIVGRAAFYQELKTLQHRSL